MKDSEAFSRLEGVIKSPMLQLNILAVITGASAAILTWIFISMTGLIQNWFYGDSLVHNNFLDSDKPWLIIFIPALGGLIAGFIIEYWSNDLANKMNQDSKYGKAKVIFARNVIPHVKEIHSILEGIEVLMNEDSLGVIEFHEAGLILKELHYDSIYHEHLFYFSLKTISKLLEKYNLKVFDITDSPISGGSWVIYFTKIKKSKSTDLKRVEKLESETGINDIQSWRSFASQASKHAKQLKNMVLNKNKILAYGASARSSTLLNFCGINSLHISSIIDKNPLKHGLYTPGSNIPIISFENGMEAIKHEKRILLLAWNFEEEVVSDLREAGFKGEIIVPLPNNPHMVDEVF